MSNMGFETREQELYRLIADAQKRCEAECKPWVEELCRLAALRPMPPIIGELAEQATADHKAGLTRKRPGTI